MNPNFSKRFKVPKCYVQDCRYGLPGQMFEFPSMPFLYKLCHEAQSVGIPYFLGEFCKVYFQNLDKSCYNYTYKFECLHFTFTEPKVSPHISKR